MAAPSPTISPISHANDWMFFTLLGVNSPGTIAPGGMKGFRRETGWDIKKGKGTIGATLTLKDMPPVKGSFELDLIGDADFVAYDDFVSKVLSIAPAIQKAQGLSVFYPGFSSIGLTTVVVKHYTPPGQVGGKRKYRVEIELLEWQQPPPASAVSTVAGTKPDGAGKGPPVQDPRIAALQAQIAALNQANKAPSR